MTDKAFSVYAKRNSLPILEVLKSEFETAKTVLEIGSGTGQHAEYLASSLRHLEWQPSDRESNIEAIAHRVEDSLLDNLRPPIIFDVLIKPLNLDHYDGVFSANTAHIMSLNAVEEMFSHVGDVLPRNGRFCLYGPFRIDGQFNAASNASFHETLQRDDDVMGIRDLEVLDVFASQQQMHRARVYAMPANNYLVVWQRETS